MFIPKGWPPAGASAELLYAVTSHAVRGEGDRLMGATLRLDVGAAVTPVKHSDRRALVAAGGMFAWVDKAGLGGVPHDYLFAGVEFEADDQLTGELVSGYSLHSGLDLRPKHGWPYCNHCGHAPVFQDGQRFFCNCRRVKTGASTKLCVICDAALATEVCLCEFSYCGACAKVMRVHLPWWQPQVRRY